jgi:hypothetical protein
MPSPASPTEAISYLNNCLQPQAAAPLCDAMMGLFQNHPDWAPVLVPVYARHLNSHEFQRLSAQFPMLSNLFNVYNRLAAAA